MSPVGVNYPTPSPAVYEYGFVLVAGDPAVVIWSLFGGLVGMDSFESADHAARKSVDDVRIVRRPKGATEYEVVTE